MAEKSYIGFKAAPGIDWGKLTSEFSQGLMQIGARRGQQDAYFDQIQRDNMKAVRETENFQNQDLNTLLSGAISQNVDNTYNINKLVKSGKMNHNAYRNFMNNASDDWTAFATTAKTLDQTIIKGLERQQPGEDGLPAGSQYEEDLIERRSQLLNLKNRAMYQDPRSGKFFLAELDQTGNIADYNNLQDVRSLNKPMNVTDNFFNYNKLVNERANSIAEYEEAYVEDIETVDGKVRKGIYMTERGEVLNPGVPEAISRVQGFIKSNPRNVFNTLAQADNRYQSYFDSKDTEGGDYQTKMNDFIEVENGARRIRGEKPLEGAELEGFVADYDRYLIPNTTDAQGIYQPAPRREDMEALDKVVESTFMSSLGYSKVEAKPPKPKASGSGGGSGSGDDEVNFDLYETLYNAIDQGKENILNNRKTAKAKDIRFSINDDKTINVYDMSDDIFGEPKDELIQKNQTLTDLVSYFYGTSGTSGGVNPEAKYNAERDAFYKANPGKEVIAMEQTDEVIEEQQPRRSIFDRILGRNNQA